MLNREEFLENITKLNLAAEKYYTTGSQIMTDAEYDYLLEQVEQAAARNSWKEADNLLNKIAAGYSGEKTIKHAKTMLSMNKVKTIPEIETFITTITDPILEPKLDGLAVALTYDNGKLVTAATRGDGTLGENVTETILKTQVKNLPKTINIKTRLEVRGEVYMTAEDFEKANIERIKRTGKPFANSRNATAGIIQKEKEANPYATLSFALYDIVGLETGTYLEGVAKLNKEGFTAATNLTGFKGNIVDNIDKFGETKNSLNYPTDGVIVKENNYASRLTIGEAEKHPKWAIAYKYEDEKKITILRDIEIAIGKTGALSFTGIFDPVELEGTTVTKATLNNVDYIINNNVKIGGEIILQKANMIIPQIISGINNEKLPAYTPPTVCPQCGGELDKATSVIWRCYNPECSILGETTYWCSTSAMDIDGLSETLISHMLEQNLINHPLDLYSLTATQLQTLKVKEGTTIKGEPYLLGEKRANTLVEKISESKKQPLWRVIAGLNIRHLGRTLSKLIVKHYSNIDNIFNLTVENLMKLEGIAEEKAKAIQAGLTAKKHLVPQIKKIGLTVSEEISTTNNNENEWIVGKKFVITGSFNGFNREELKETLENLGGVSAGTVTSNTNILIVGEKAGSKLAKAKELGIQIVDENKLVELLT